jgi:hypothetical protein
MPPTTTGDVEAPTDMGTVQAGVSRDTVLEEIDDMPASLELR